MEEEDHSSNSSGSSVTVFSRTEYSLFHTIVALAMWLGTIHFNVALVLAALILLPFRIALLFVYSLSSSSSFVIASAIASLSLSQSFFLSL